MAIQVYSPSNAVAIHRKQVKMCEKEENRCKSVKETPFQSKSTSTRTKRISLTFNVNLRLRVSYTRKEGQKGIIKTMLLEQTRNVFGIDRWCEWYWNTNLLTRLWFNTLPNNKI